MPPVPVERIARDHLGLLIDEHDDLRSLPGAPQDQGQLSGMIDPPNMTIWLDRREAQSYPGRRRFTIAHELGHWQLHVNAGDGVFYDRGCDISDVSAPASAGDKGLGRREAEANEFARELLMPELLMREQATATGCNLAALSERFGVSRPAMILRLRLLRLLPPGMG